MQKYKTKFHKLNSKQNVKKNKYYFKIIYNNYNSQGKLNCNHAIKIKQKKNISYLGYK